ncbi:hypothetical protein LINGRAHAP2_LOCUS24417 [Linum grandiflorum]
MWQPMGRFRMVDLESEVFLAIFEDPNDYFQALTGGPWTILDHYLTVFTWDTNFRVSDDLPQKMVVWVRFPRLPYQYYHCDVLTGLGNLIGKTVRPDIRTQNSVRGKFARIAVEIDLSVPAPKGVFVDGFWQVVKYENLHSFCRDCGRFGHEVGMCDRRRSLVSSTPECPVPLAVVSSPDGSNQMGANSVEPDGPWQIVTRKTRRPNKGSNASSNGTPQIGGEGKGKQNQGVLKLGRSDSSVKSASGGKISDLPSSKKLSVFVQKSDGRSDGFKKVANGPSSSGLNKKKKSKVQTDGSVAQSLFPSKFARLGSKARLPSAPLVDQTLSKPPFSVGLPTATEAQLTDLATQLTAPAVQITASRAQITTPMAQLTSVSPVLPTPIISTVNGVSNNASGIIVPNSDDLGLATKKSISLEENSIALISSPVTATEELTKQQQLVQILSDSFSTDILRPNHLPPGMSTLSPMDNSQTQISPPKLIDVVNLSDQPGFKNVSSNVAECFGNSRIPLDTNVSGVLVSRNSNAHVMVSSEKKSVTCLALRGKATRQLKSKSRAHTKNRKAISVAPTIFNKFLSLG